MKTGEVSDQSDNSLVLFSSTSTARSTRKTWRFLKMILRHTFIYFATVYRLALYSSPRLFNHLFRNEYIQNLKMFISIVIHDTNVSRCTPADNCWWKPDSIKMSGRRQCLGPQQVLAVFFEVDAFWCSQKAFPAFSHLRTFATQQLASILFSMACNLAELSTNFKQSHNRSAMINSYKL